MYYKVDSIKIINEETQEVEELKPNVPEGIQFFAKMIDVDTFIIKTDAILENAIELTEDEVPENVVKFGTKVVK